MKDGVREFPPVAETSQRVWTAYKLVTGEARASGDLEFWINWYQRAELTTVILFLMRRRRFPESEAEFEDEFSGEMILQAKVKCRSRGYDLTWDRAAGFVLHRGATSITLVGPVANEHPFAGID